MESDVSGKKIVQGAEEIVAFLNGEGPARTYEVQLPFAVDVKGVRARTGLTQLQFAERFGFSLAAVRHWEQGTRMPEKAARILLTLIDKHPDFVREALRNTGTSLAAE
jgi:putative transcriptional regulator